MHEFQITVGKFIECHRRIAYDDVKFLSSAASADQGRLIASTVSHGRCRWLAWRSIEAIRARVKSDDDEYKKALRASVASEGLMT